MTEDFARNECYTFITKDTLVDACGIWPGLNETVQAQIDTCVTDILVSSRS